MRQMYSDKEYEQVLVRVGQILDEMERSGAQIDRALVDELMRHFDAIHRESLSRLVAFLESDQPDLLLKLKSDFAIRHLLGLYDLASFDGIEKASQHEGFVPESEVKKIG